MGCGVLAVGLTGMVLLLMLVRCTGRFDNEWVESSMVNSAVRVLNGRPLYAPPSVEYVGDNYPPLYFFLCGGLMTLSGPSPLVCRLVSVSSTLAVALAIWVVGGSRSSDGRPRLIWVALFFAFYAAGVEVYDLARVDMAAIALAAWALVAVVRTQGLAGAAAGGLCMALAILTKHNMALVGVFLGAGLLASQWRRAIVYGVISAGLPAVVLTWHQIASDGWCWFYLFTQPSMHPFGGWNTVVRFLSRDLGHHGFLLAAELVAAAWVLLRVRPKTSAAQAINLPVTHARPRDAVGLRLVLLAATGGLLATLIGRFKIGGFPNNLCVAWVFALLAAAWAAPRVWTRLLDAGGSRPARFVWVFWVVTAVQLISLSRAFAALPLGSTFEWADRGQAVAELDRLTARYAEEGPVWVPYHSTFSRPRGSFAHLCPVGFLMDAPGHRAKSMFEEDLARNLARRTWSAIILDRTPDGFVSERCARLLKTHYEEVPLPIAEPQRTATLVGKRTHPQFLFVRR
jgi:hypothetical protein